MNTSNKHDKYITNKTRSQTMKQTLQILDIEQVIETLNRIKTGKINKNEQIIRINANSKYADLSFVDSPFNNTKNTVTINFATYSIVNKENDDNIQFAVNFYELLETLQQLKSIDNVADIEIYGDEYIKIKSDFLSIKLNQKENLDIFDEVKHFNLIAMKNNSIYNIDDTYINPQDLINNLETVKKFAATKENNMPVITGTKFELKEDGFKTIAIDGFRIGLNEYKLKSPDHNSDFDIIVNPRQMNALIKILRNNKKELSQIQFLKNDDGKVNIVIHLKNHFHCISIISEELGGNFFDYKSIIPPENNHEITLNRNNLINTCKIINKKPTDKGYPLMKFHKPVDATNIIISNGQETIESEFTNINPSNDKDLLFALNSSFLIDALNNVDKKAKEVTLKTQQTEFRGELMVNAPITITDNPTDKCYKNDYLILPVRIND